MDIYYNPDLEKRLRNVSVLPVGRGAKYLLCILGEGDTLVAKQWLRSRPKVLAMNERLVNFVYRNPKKED